VLGLALALLGWVGALEAQVRTDRRPLAAVLAAPDPFLGLGVGVSRWGRFGVGGGGSVAGGVRGDRAAGRAEAWVGYHLSPARSRGWGPYAGVGGAFLAGGGDPAGYLVVFVGAESRPAAGRGWFAEVGVGGGPRFVVGYRISRRRRA